MLARLDPGRGAEGPVVVHGPAGVGKTLLARAAAQRGRAPARALRSSSFNVAPRPVAG
ncbi:AAA family ATPase [Streptomyces mutabilis]|uniref:AAA family ATPase n=1 Tax=Streptomyces mutabilis TaxID=67332 RepID=UPI0034DDF1B2